MLATEPGMEIYDPCCGSCGLLVKCEIAMEEEAKGRKRSVAPLKLYGQEYTADTFKNPKFRNKQCRLRTFDRVVANPMWNQDWFTEADDDNEELNDGLYRFITRIIQ